MSMKKIELKCQVCSIFLGFLCSAFLVAECRTSPDDASAMLALKTSLPDPESLGWSNPDPCKWNHVVTSIPFDFFLGLSSSIFVDINNTPFSAFEISESFKNASTLHNFWANFANTTGKIPVLLTSDEFQDLSNLHLALHNLEGEFPLGSQIQSLRLNGQKLGGEINVIQDVTHLKNLESLSLADNSFPWIKVVVFFAIGAIFVLSLTGVAAFCLYKREQRRFSKVKYQNTVVDVHPRNFGSDNDTMIETNNVLPSLSDLWKPSDQFSKDINGISRSMSSAQALSTSQTFEGCHADMSCSFHLPTLPYGFDKNSRCGRISIDIDFPDRSKMALKSKKGWKSIAPLHSKGKSASKSANYGYYGNTPVYLNVYDLTPLNGCVYWAGLGIFHSGVEVHGVEYAFEAHEDCGVYEVEPQKCPGFTFRKSIFIGTTCLDKDEISEFMERQAASYNRDTYHLIANNCNHFCKDICYKLTGKKVPKWVNRMAKLGSILLCISQRPTRL